MSQHKFLALAPECCGYSGGGWVNARTCTGLTAPDLCQDLYCTNPGKFVTSLDRLAQEVGMGNRKAEQRWGMPFLGGGRVGQEVDRVGERDWLQR